MACLCGHPACDLRKVVIAMSATVAPSAPAHTRPQIPGAIIAVDNEPIIAVG